MGTISPRAGCAKWNLLLVQREETAWAQREPSCTHTPPPPSSGKHQCQRTKGYGPSTQGKARFQLIYTIPCLTSGLQAPKDRLHNWHYIFLLLLLQCSLWFPSVPFWEMSIKKNVLQTQRLQEASSEAQ